MRKTISIIALFTLFVAIPILFARGGGGCFLPGTVIQTPDGVVPIENISIGQAVLSFSLFDGDTDISTSLVSDIYLVERDYYYTITATNAVGNASVNVTAEHPFYISDGQFKEAQDLRPGDTIYVYLLKGSSLAPAAVYSVSRVNSSTIAYNLHVDSFNTFFANSFAVHNKGGGGGGGGGFGGGFSGHYGSHSSSPPSNIHYYNCDPLAKGQSNCCAPVSSYYRSTTADLNSLAPASFAKIAYCKCRRSGLSEWESTSSYSPVYAECNCINRPDYNPATVSKCFDFEALCSSTGICFGFFIVFIIISFLGGAKHGKHASGEWSSTISVPSSKVIAKSKKVTTLLALWCKVDQVWAEDRLKGDAKKVFLKLQECWSARDYTEMKDLMTPGIYSEHVAQLEAMKSRHEINKMENTLVLDLQIVLVKNYHDKQKDSFVAWIKATARDTIIDDRTGKKIRGDVGMGTFEEFWTFQRDGDAWKLKQIDQPEEGMNVIDKENFDSISTPGMLGRTYEKAGGPQIKDIGAGSTRERADDSVGLDTDKIKSKSGRVSRLLNFLVQQSPIWNEDKMRAYARGLFISLNVAVETKNLEPVKDNLKPELYDQYSKLVSDLMVKKQRMEKRNLAVRNVEIVLVKNYNDNSKDEFTAWISGQAQTVLVDEKSGGAVGGDDYVADFEEYWTFRREGDAWKLCAVERGFKKYVDEENFDEGTGKDMLEWYYKQDRAV